MRLITQLLKVGCALLALATVSSYAREASANGRFPRADRLIEDPRDSKHLLLAATYGLLVTEDGGASWQHVCEGAFTDPTTESDAIVALSGKGDVLLSSVDRFSRSAGDLCGFEPTLGDTEDEGVPDFTLDANGAVLAIKTASGAGKPLNQLQVSMDDGRKFQPLGRDLPESVLYLTTVDAAPSDPRRLYLSGLDSDGHALLLRSDDRGETYRTLSIPTKAGAREVPYIAAVHPSNADLIYVRTDTWASAGDQGGQVADDALFVSEDGGETFSEVLRAGGKLFGFALSPNGEDLVVGYGDPVMGPGRATRDDELGIYHARVGSSSFEQLSTGSTTCLTWSKHGIYACLVEADMGFTLGLSAIEDIEQGLAPWTPLMSMRGAITPLTTAGCSSGQRCAAEWSAFCESWGRTDCDDASPTSQATSEPLQPSEPGGCTYGHGPSRNATLLLALLCAYALRRAFAARAPSRA